MDIAEVFITAGGLLFTAVFAGFLFGPKQAGEAKVSGDVQEVAVRIKGGYSGSDPLQQGGAATSPPPSGHRGPAPARPRRQRLLMGASTDGAAPVG
jgi:hypothetical protein